MGKQKIERLLAQLQGNHSQDIQNAAAIFTVAQGAVKQLDQIDRAAPAQTVLPAAPISLTKADLESRYGKFNACRKAAKQAGITFSKTPSWSQLVAAFSYLEACQSCVDAYLQDHPCPDLKGVRLSLRLGN
ncbi:hypothetical protein IQ241_08030 [Romeria aff. gracilis LEGE 07310]|uniref:Uncharacterized protein n=1 Tax=Vasconcelosia minhoensis LEGE 07310 TaxID=915328 RepID=A0A8J7DB55_9CYAN|nr:hypothetical protein [Romeria gracilis]MBE9077242.1 hypothetical protein [Romeria aff. gracilis LEGE 07310]